MYDESFFYCESYIPKYEKNKAEYFEIFRLYILIKLILMTCFSFSAFHMTKIFGTVCSEDQNNQIAEYRNNKGMLYPEVIRQEALEDRNDCTAQYSHDHKG